MVSAPGTAWPVGVPVDRAMPKSMISTLSSSLIMMLAGFRSRWTTPALCASTRPATTDRAMCSTRGDRQFAVCFNTVARSAPSTYGIVMYLMPLMSPRS